MNTINALLIALIPSVLSAIIIKKISNIQLRNDEIIAQRHEFKRLMLEALNAIFCMLKELYVCVLLKRTPNGELKEAFDYMQDVKHKIEDYERRHTSKI